MLKKKGSLDGGVVGYQQHAKRGPFVRKNNSDGFNRRDEKTQNQAKGRQRHRHEFRLSDKVGRGTSYVLIVGDSWQASGVPTKLEKWQVKDGERNTQTGGC